MNKNSDWLTIARKHGYSMPDARFQNFVAELLESRPAAAPVVAEGIDTSALQMAHAALLASQPRSPQPDAWKRHEAALNLVFCALHRPKAAHPVAGSPAEHAPTIDLWHVALKAIRKTYDEAFGPHDPNITSNDIDWHICEIIKAAAAEPMPASEVHPILANGLPVEQTSMEWVCRFISENSSFDGKDILRSWNELVAFYVANRATAAQSVRDAAQPTAAPGKEA